MPSVTPRAAAERLISRRRKRGEEFEERLEAVREVLAAVEQLPAVPEKTPPKPLTEDLSCFVRRR